MRESAGEYNQLTTETKQFSDLLENFRDLVTRVKLSGPQFAQLVAHEKSSQLLLDSINGILDRYQSLGGAASKLSNKITWSRTTTRDLRTQITSQVCILQSFYMTISQCAVLDALERLKLSMQAGTTRCPSIAALSQASNHEGDNDKSDWSELTRDLENLGITASLAKTHRNLILRYFETAVAHGELPFRDGSESFYSGPVCDYKNVLDKVTAWIQTRLSETESVVASEHLVSTDIRPADETHEDGVKESRTHSAIAIDTASGQAIISDSIFLSDNLDGIDMDMLAVVNGSPLLLCVNLLLRCKPYRRYSIHETKRKLVSRNKWKPPSTRFWELYDLAIRTLSSSLASGVTDVEILAAIVAFANVDVLISGPERMGDHVSRPMGTRVIQIKWIPRGSNT